MDCRTGHVLLLVSKNVTSCSECMYLLRVLCLFFLGNLYRSPNCNPNNDLSKTSRLRRFPKLRATKSFVLDNSHVDQYNSYTRRDQIQWHPRRIYIVPRIDDVTTAIAMKKFVPEFGSRGAIMVAHVAFYRHHTWQRVISDSARRNN